MYTYNWQEDEMDPALHYVPLVTGNLAPLITVNLATWKSVEF